MISCVIFDFDGTVADTERLSLEIYNELAEKYGYNKFSEDDVEYLKQNSWAALFKASGVPAVKVPKLLREGQSILARKMAEIKPFSHGFAEFISSLRSQLELIGVVSSNTRENIEGFFNSHSIDHPDFIVTASLFSKASKINYILKKHRVKSADTVYVGDEIRDIEAAQKSNVRSACVTWGYNTEAALIEAKPTFLISSFEELLSIIKDENGML